MNNNVTELLREALSGDQLAIENAFHAVAPDLRRLVRAKRHYRNRAERTTGLVDIVFEEFLNHPMNDVANRAQFFAWATRVVITTLSAKRRYEDAYKRSLPMSGSLEDLWSHIGDIPDYETALALEQAYDRLRESEPEAAGVFERRFIFGQENAEIAEEMDISLSTVERRLRFIRSYYKKIFKKAEG